jgi:hypothetical protein
LLRKDLLGGERVDRTGRRTAGAEGAEAAAMGGIQQGLGHDAACRVSFAKEQHIVGFIGHVDLRCCADTSCGYTGSARQIQCENSHPSALK